MKKQYKKILIGGLAIGLLVSQIACNRLWIPEEETGTNAYILDEFVSSEEAESSQTITEEENHFRTAGEVVADIKIGWNVGNSLDSYGDWIKGETTSDYETAWGNPVITRELIQCVKAQGFNAVRVPVTYLHFMDEQGTIDEVWLARVKEVVDYVIDEDMYCIIDIHHDTGASDSAWIVADPYQYENGMKERFAYAWKQIAEYFIDYDDRLIFEGMNEVLDASWNWGGSTGENYEVINQLNQVFVDTVRATGGNNAERNLIVVAYGNSSHESQMSGFVLPRDTTSGHMIIGIHVYEPDAFCNGNDIIWDEYDKQTLDATFERINSCVLQRYRMPVIIGEFGSRELEPSEENRQARAEFAGYFVQKAEELGITCFWWDDGGSMKIIDRVNNSVYDEETVRALIQASE